MKVQAALIRNQHAPISLHKKKPRTASPKTDWQPMLSFGCLLLGLFFGVALFTLQTERFLLPLKQYIDVFLSAANAAFFVRWRSALLPTVCFGLILMYLGVSPIGTAAILPLLLLRAASVGLLGAFLKEAYPTGGLAFFYVCLFPSKALQLIGLFLLSKSALKCSGYIKSCLKTDNTHPVAFFSYGLACLPGLCCLALASLTDVFLQQFNASFPLAGY